MMIICKNDDNHDTDDDESPMTPIPGVGSPAKRHVALDVEFAPSFVDNKVF